MPRLHLPGYPGRFDSDGRRMRFRRHDGIYQSDVGSLKTKPEPNIASRQCSDSSPRTRREDQRSRPIVSMSSGRLFLDRVGRHQSPSSLHRRDQIKLVARSEGTIYHRTVTSALTGCLTFRDKPRQTPNELRKPCRELIRLKLFGLSLSVGLRWLRSATVAPVESATASSGPLATVA